MSDTPSNPLALGIPVQRPPHDRGVEHPVPVSIVAEWPAGTFVENLLPRPTGTALVTIHSTNELVEVNLDNGAKRVLVTFPASCAGIVEIGDSLYVNVGAIGQPGAAIYKVRADGQAERWVEMPDALFLNGAAALSDHEMLVGDAILGRVFLVDIRERTQRVWLDNDLLRKISSEPMLPGVNGIKIHAGHVWFSNTDRALLLKTTIGTNGEAGPLEAVAERLVADDFAFDTNGALYLTTHVHNTLMRLLPNGTREEMAGPEQYLAGCTAAAFGRAPGDRNILYVTTTGGILEPWGGTVATAKLLRLDIGAAGAPITR